MSGGPPLGALGEAFRLLTALPWPGAGGSGPETRRWAAAAFPVVGLVVGAAGAAAGWGAGWLWGEPARAISVLLAWGLLSGGLHLDGLADSCDALLSWQPRERKLEILRDSRIGVMGGLGLLAVLALQAAAIVALGEAFWAGALLAPVWGRWCAAYALWAFPAARRDGLGAAYRTGASGGPLALASALALLIGLAAAPPWGVLAGIAALALAHLLGRGISAALGGITGDGYGALVEAGQTATLLLLAALARHGVTLAPARLL